MQIRRKLIKDSKQSQIAFLSMMEPKNFEEASEDEEWVKAMNEETLGSWFLDLRIKI